VSSAACAKPPTRSRCARPLADGIIDCVSAPITAPALRAERNARRSSPPLRPGHLGLPDAALSRLVVQTNGGSRGLLGLARCRRQVPMRLEPRHAHRPGFPDHGRARLAGGEPGELTVVTPTAHWTVARADLASRSPHRPNESMTCPPTVDLDLAAREVTARDVKSPGMNFGHDRCWGSPLSSTRAGGGDRGGDPAMIRGWRPSALRRKEDLLGALARPCPDTVWLGDESPPRGLLRLQTPGPPPGNPNASRP